MIRITLPDGSLREYDQPLSVHEVAASIGAELASAAVAGRVDGVLVDCEHLIDADARVSIVTPREPDGLEILRRSCALMLAMAVKQLHPHAQLREGSELGDGFFYEFTSERPLSPTDLPGIEARMQALAATNHSIRRQPLPSLEKGLSLYRLGDTEYQSRGPHVPATKVLQAFALDHISGTLQQRIYGTCWSSHQELQYWQIPPKVVVVSMDDRQTAYAQAVTETLRQNGVRARADLRNEKVRYKIRQHSQSVPYLVVIGEKEQTGGFVSVRSRTGEDFGRMGVEAACQWLSQPEDGE
ncbi:His/Gly/Thr/Pro-type tRNA ligase C-terminal domain-containing protein [Pseudomonas vancouverensis]|uniref:TGS domain-containing protein n=1 Tax=Pseudomonas vancouverensis TaxID=95300 RepID=A0A1H2PDS0_PSEVA|nr:His/Gly/Thr/Pro-type tRNA ligase C-terminal domain-containing protein [Pseudomonas vancouverensis]KAB0498025.1 TGS domain-containing protein [Pseudomonas vancouverensis]TDB66752.1 TGS domain-containing protein [Pseudomonas vancouverensis]SDV15840.1 threonyl-tRNA synthetase [Pseudomonas vancouverensis]